MKRLLAAASLVLSPALASANALDALRAMAGGVEIAVAEAPQGVPAGRIIAGTPGVKPARVEVIGEGSVHGSATFNYRGGGIGGREAGARSGIPKSIPVEGEIAVTGPDGATGKIKVYGSVMLFDGSIGPNTKAHVGGNGPLYKDGKVVGEATVSGSALANVQLMGDAFGRASAFLTVTGSFKPAQ